ncbi:hypothetical protein DV735_g5850, partial [Chaetothyriales sp. CBS 134920]
MGNPRDLSPRGSQSTSHREYEDFFRYTSGRWIWDEEQQLQDRYKVFNVAELQTAAAKSVGSARCVSMIKLAEGGYNKVFRLIMDDGKTVIARIPNPNAGPPFYTTASEVATMELARSVLHIPVPQVYEWNACADNAVGSEYIIMEEAVGTQLGDAWDEMTPVSKLAVMREIVSIEKKLLSLTYGNIYFQSDTVKGAVPAEVLNDVPLDLKSYVSKRFTIGPSADRGFWAKERSSMAIDRGPSVGRREISWIKRYAAPRVADDLLLVSAAQNSPEAHIQLLEKFLKVAPFLINIDKQFLCSTLWHTDLHSPNIFVDGNRITAIIDWQGISAGPLFLQAHPSPLVDYQGRMLLKRPDNFDSLDDEQKAAIKKQISRSTLLQLYLMETQEQNPTLARVFDLDHGKTRRLPVELASNTWDADIVPFREALLNVERYWQELGHDMDCPIHFTDDEVKQHLQDAEGWNEVQDFFDSIEDLVKRDGWTHNETFAAALEFFATLRKVGLKEMTGKERERFEKETRWAEKKSVHRSGFERMLLRKSRTVRRAHQKKWTKKVIEFAIDVAQTDAYLAWKQYRPEPDPGHREPPAAAPSSHPAMSALPQNQAAWLPAKQEKPLKVGPAPYTVPGTGEVVVKNAAVAVNPIDWAKQQIGDVLLGYIKYPCILGGDVAGTVVDVGPGVQRFGLGDRVVAAAVGIAEASNRPAEGGFQLYTVVREYMAAPLPPHISEEQALRRAHDPVHGRRPRAVIITGGSTSVGANAVQLAVAAGYEVVSTASPKNHAYVRSLGASHVFDYRSNTLVRDMLAALKDRSLAGAYAIGDGAVEVCTWVLRRHPFTTNKFIAMAGGSPMGHKLASGLQQDRSSLLISIARSLDPAGVVANIFLDFLPTALASNQFIPAPTPLVVGNGLDMIQEAMDVQMKGVSAQKVVVTLSEGASASGADRR